jgi:phthiodiolone/phenolphthiodiolone dimycocerosates ketoreductase
MKTKASDVEIAIPLLYDRNFPPSAWTAAAKALEASGVVDYLQTWDQLTSWFPKSMWTVENTPLAAMMPDCDSFCDAFTMGVYAQAAAPGLGTVISTDAIRTGPAELTQKMMTISDLTQGRSIFQLGAGEIKQCKPFGWKRAQGLGRLEDHYKAFDALWNAKGPIDLPGNHVNLTNAWLGGTKNHRPRLWGLGGGPKFAEITASYADGFVTMCPWAATTPERWAEMIANMKQIRERAGRDPEDFSFGLWASVLLHDDPDVIDRALDNPFNRWWAAIAGRLNQSDWEIEGITAPWPADWHYSRHLLPAELGDAEARAIVDRGTREMAEKSFFTGSASDVAAQLKPYIEAGANWISVIDLLPFVLDPEEAIGALPRSIDVARCLKQ